MIKYKHKIAGISIYLHQLFLILVSLNCIWGDMYFGDGLGSLYVMFGIFVFTIISLVTLIFKKKIGLLLLSIILAIYFLFDYLIIKSVVHW